MLQNFNSKYTPRRHLMRSTFHTFYTYWLTFHHVHLHIPVLLYCYVQRLSHFYPEHQYRRSNTGPLHMSVIPFCVTLSVDMSLNIHILDILLDTPTLLIQLIGVQLDTRSFCLLYMYYYNRPQPYQCNGWSRTVMFPFYRWIELDVFASKIIFSSRRSFSHPGVVTGNI